MNTNVKTLEKLTAAEEAEGVETIPADALSRIDQDSKQAGGEFVMPAEYIGSIGRTMFDLPTSDDGTITMILPRETIDAIPSQALVRIRSVLDKRSYLGAVVKGPFAEPDGMRADSTPMIVSATHGGLLMPKYHGRAGIEILGEELEDGTVVPPRRRPKPNSPVFALNAEETQRVLRSRGTLRLGLADGFEDLPVSVPPDEKGVFPRHLGILGTTGGGKSTTVSGLVHKAQVSGMATVLIDVEGEYCAIDEPTQDAAMIAGLKRRGLPEPSGVQNTHVYHLVGRETKNPAHPRVTPFSLKFSELSPYAVQEVLELNEAQEERFFKAYEIAKLAMERFGIWPKTPEDKARVLELDEFDTGFPNMRLGHLYDVVAQIAAIQANDPDPYLETKEFRENRDQLKQVINGQQLPKSVPSWRKVQGRLGLAKRLKVFDSAQAAPLNYLDMLQPGGVSIVDLSDTDSPLVRNLVIAQLLRGIQVAQDQRYEEAAKNKVKPTPASVFIEEAHEFLSAARIKKMEALFQQVARIARRGRKRWLGLVFVSQMPQHLPDEVLALINNWILHKISDSGVIHRLKGSVGSIPDSMWRSLPSLAPGQAIASFTTLSRAIQMTIDPTPCKLLMVD